MEKPAINSGLYYLILFPPFQHKAYERGFTSSPPYPNDGILLSLVHEQVDSSNQEKNN
jgi:hypothetical protein